MKKIIFTLSLGIIGLLQSHAQTTQIVDLSTGVQNGTTSLLPVNTYDDTWKFIGHSGPVPVKCATLSAWATDPHARWISPFVTSAGVADTGGILTNYAYMMTFTPNSSCNVGSALVTLNKYGGDNIAKELMINGDLIGIPPATFNPLLSTTVSIPVADITPGIDTLYVIVENQLSAGSYGDDTYTGLYMYGNLAINYTDNNLIPTFTGNTQFCQGAPLTFVGADGPSTATNTFWEIAAADASGNVTPGGYVWNQWYSGAPGSYTFPSSVYSSLPCNAYYNIKMAIQNSCLGWIATVKTIHINCPPTAEAGQDDTICSGSCVTIGEPIINKGTTYLWSTAHSPFPIIVGHTETISVCPTTTTTYTVTASNSAGCSSTDAVTVYVVHNDPSFSLLENTALTSYFTVVLYPNDVNGFSNPGFYYGFDISELNTSGAPLYTDSGTDAWWFYPNNTFKGFDATTYPAGGNYTQTAWWAPAPNDGRFLYGHTYKITRYTKNAACNTYVPYSIVIAPAPHMLMQNGNQKMEVYEGKDADDFIARMAATAVENPGNELSVYPNPGNGIFTISTTNLTGGIMEVYDVRGTKIQSVEIKNTDTYSLDLTNYAKGIYMIKMNVDNKVITKKIILQ